MADKRGLIYAALPCDMASAMRLLRLAPRRLTVALSRAKRKMILVASRSIFQSFLTDEEQFANLQL